jgi:putative transposase
MASFTSPRAEWRRWRSITTPTIGGTSSASWRFAVEQYDWTCQAFCLMTNHYHLVLDATRENLSGGMQILNGDYAQSFNGKYGRWGHVFGDRFWCRSLDDEQLEHVCLYVVENPVRAGLCNEIGDWPWSACRFELG